MPFRNLALLRSAALHALLAASFALLGPSFAVGEQVDGSALSAAFDACSGQPTSVEERLLALDDGNWLILDDNSRGADLFHLAFASEQSGSWVPGEGAARKAANAGQRARPLTSWVEPTSGAKAARVPGGAPLDTARFIAFADKFNASAVLYFATRDATMALRMLVFPENALQSGYFLSCDLYLANPLPLAEFGSLLPNSLKPADLKIERKHSGIPQDLITYATTSGYSGKVVRIDAGDLSALKEHLSRNVTTASLATIVRFESTNLRLTDQFRPPSEVTP